MKAPSAIHRTIKRLTDIVGSLIGLIVFAIAYIPVGIAIKLEDRGPILIKLPRVSKGEIIQLYKFRSMMIDAARLKKGLLHMNERNDGPFFKIKNDPRLTKVGRIIRKFRIDELPQFINVLKNELSLVGPRPHEQGELSNYPKEFTILIKAKAGITGLSQVSGASSLPFLKEITLDKEYLEKQTLWLDFKILIKTIWIMFFDPSAA